MGYTGRAPSRATLTSQDIENGIIAEEDLDTTLAGKINGKAEQSTTYTKTETDAKIVELAPTPDLSGLVDKVSDESVGGVKTFTSFPVTPSTAPTTDYQVANKKYVDGINFGFKNYIINGGFDVWQRGTSFSSVSSGAYTADRWKLNSNGSVMSISRGTGIDGHDYSLSVNSNGTYTEIYQNVEGAYLSNKIVTFKAKFSATSGSSVRLRLVDSTGAYNFLLQSGSTLADGTIQEIEFTTTLGVISQGYLFAGVHTTSATNLVVYQVQLEEGSIATPFEQRPIALETMLCKRYYNVITYVGGATPHAGVAVATAIVTNIDYPTMRVIPTATLTSLIETKTTNTRISNRSVNHAQFVSDLSGTSTGTAYAMATVVLDAEL